MTLKSPSTQTRFLRRRLAGLLLVAAGVVAVGWWAQEMTARLASPAFGTGYVLMAALFILTALGIRKRLVFLPNIGSTAFWMQLHQYVGLAAIMLLGIHVRWQVPQGWLEGTLAVLFLIVSVSGVYGLWISRTYPSRLTSVGGEVIYEQIPMIRSRIASQARSLIVSASGDDDVLGRFYVNRLAAFLELPRDWSYCLMPSSRQKRELLSDLSGLQRYLSVERRKAGQVLGELIEQRDRLDYHQVLQGRLKLWLFVHVGFTYSLLLLSLTHMVLAHAFAGAA